MDSLIIPSPLKHGDRVAIVSPASAVDPVYVHGAVAVLRDCGLDPCVAPHALGRQGSYSGTVEERLSDITSALLDPAVRAVMCSRGGYGTVHLLDSLSQLPLRDDPKWLIGFSDISALHALMGANGIAGIHSSMAKHMARGVDFEPSRRLLGLLHGGCEGYEVSAPDYPLNRYGHAEGCVAGGNLAVLADLVNTPFDMLRPDIILFIEDIAEPIYKVERILYQLRLSGVLPRLRGLVVGQFTEYRSDRNYTSMEEMIHDMVAGYDYPVAFNAPIGHVDGNMPVIESVPARLAVTPAGMTLSY